MKQKTQANHLLLHGHGVVSSTASHIQRRGAEDAEDRCDPGEFLLKVRNWAETRSLSNVAEPAKRLTGSAHAQTNPCSNAEICVVKIPDIDSQLMPVHIRQSKGNKDRYVPLSEKLLRELRQYWVIKRPKQFLIPSRDGKGPVNISVAQNAYYTARNRAGITKGKDIHTLRHSGVLMKVCLSPFLRQADRRRHLRSVATGRHRAWS